MIATCKLIMIFLKRIKINQNEKKLQQYCV